MSDFALAAANSKMQSIFLADNEAGNTNKVPRLMSMDDYSNWKSRFKIWINGQDTRMWEKIQYGYGVPRGEGGRPVTLESGTMDLEQRKDYDTEARAYAYLCQALAQDIYHQFKLYVTSKTLWDALETRNEGNESFRRKKGRTLKNEFDKFVCMKNESLYALIERFFHLLTEMHNHDIVTSDSDAVHCLADALPEKWDSFIMVLRSTGTLSRTNINNFVAILKEQELDNENKQKKYSQVQDPTLYFSGSNTPSVSSHAPLQTAFVSNTQGSSSSNSQPTGVSPSSSAPEACSAKLKTENFKK